MQVTRGKILAYLGDHPPSSSGEISRYLEMTPANIRYHLDILVDEGFVCVSGRRPTGGSGRPILLYNLTARNLGDNLNTLLRGFLNQLIEAESREKTLKRIAKNLLDVGEIRNRVQRFNAGIEKLNAMHYHASWEARPEGPRIELRHCPYQDIAQDHPLLCQLDEEILCRIFGNDIQLVQKRDFEQNPTPPCVFANSGGKG
jgi:predicted ArsR family transcriptional regulator